MAHWLIVGLGNPGEEYAETRHNIGWMVCGALVAKHKTKFEKGNGDFLFAEITHRKSRLSVVLPLLYMNRSGVPTKSLLRSLKLPAEQLVAVVDEYNFPLGKVHLKKGGSDGGHNGITSLITELHTPNFYRLRCGIDKNFSVGGMSDYVLAQFTSEELVLRNAMIELGIKAIEEIAELGGDKAMQRVNSAVRQLSSADGDGAKSRAKQIIQGPTDNTINN